MKARRAALAAILAAILASPAIAAAQPAQPPDAAPKDAQPKDAAPKDAQPKDAQPKDAAPKDGPATSEGSEAPKVVEPPAVEKPSAPAQPAPALQPAPAHHDDPQSGFAFGTYGRMIAASDVHRGPGRDADIVAHGSRLDEGNYVELELRRDDYWQKTDSATRVVATLALANPVFHYNGDFNVKMAVRNLYIEERGLGAKKLSIWAGSRMYRGDDIYLLDYWPLDNANTVGGGARYDFSKNTYAAIHMGFSMPNTIFYYQDTQRPAVFDQPGATTVNILARQRFIGSAKVSHIFPIGLHGGVKIVGYAEAHHLPAGQRETDPRVFEDLPSDGGYVIGAQIGAFTGERDTHLNFFFRYASGLAAYGDFASPTQLSTDRTARGAHELVAAVGGNWEAGPIGVMLGGYIRSFRDASRDLDFSDVDEGIIAVRPHLFFGELGGLAVEGSYQATQRGVVTLVGDDGKTAESKGPFSAGLFRFGVIPFLSPAGRGDYSRPQFRIIYALTVRGKNARMLYPQDDVFSIRPLEHFIGFGAEWWFNSSSYGG